TTCRPSTRGSNAGVCLSNCGSTTRLAVSWRSGTSVKAATRRRPSAAASALALGAAVTLWLHQALPAGAPDRVLMVPTPAAVVLLDRAFFLAAFFYVLSQAALGLRAQWQRWHSRPGKSTGQPLVAQTAIPGQYRKVPGVRGIGGTRLGAALALGLVVLAQTL